MNTFSILDYAIFIGYACVIMFIGLFVSRTKKGQAKSSQDYFLASRSLAWWAIGASIIASNISAEQFIGMSGSGFAIGLGIASYEFIAAATLIIVAVFFLPIYLKANIYTMPQFLEIRYDKRVKTIMAFFWLLVFIFVNLTSILYLNSPNYTILNWIAVLVAHRLFSIKSPAAQRAKRYLIDNFGVNVNAYDLIIGYRADDSYFDFAASFLNNGISVQQLANAMRLGKLGEQIVIKSKYAFSLLHYDGFSIAEKEKYYVRRKARNDEADQLYSDILEEETDGLYILDIIRGGIQNDDPRIPRNLSE